MVGVNIGDTLTPTPWTPEKIEQVLSEASYSGYFDCDAVKFWHCDARRVLPTAQHDRIQKASREMGMVAWNLLAHFAAVVAVAHEIDTEGAAFPQAGG